MTAAEFKALHNFTDEQLQSTRDAINRAVERDKAGFGGCVKDVPWPRGEGPIVTMKKATQ